MKHFNPACVLFAFTLLASCSRAEKSSYSAENCYNADEQKWRNCRNVKCTTKRVINCSPYEGKLLHNQCESILGSLHKCEKIECEPYGGSTYTCAPTDQKPSGDLNVRHVFGRIDAQTTEGNIDVNHCGGENTDVTLSTSGGNINVANCTGRIMLKTSGGDLDLNNLTGIINAMTRGGNIRASTLTGNTTVQSSGGHLSLDFVSGELSATTSGGNIVALMPNITGDTQIKSSRGNVDFTFPAGHYNLTITGTRVDVSGLNNFNGTKTKKSLIGQLNGGGIPIVVSGATVSIHVIEESDDDDDESN